MDKDNYIDNDKEIFDIIKIIEIVLSKKLFLIIFTFIFTLIGFVYTNSIEEKFTSKITIAPITKISESKFNTFNALAKELSDFNLGYNAEDALIDVFSGKIELQKKINEILSYQNNIISIDNLFLVENFVNILKNSDIFLNAFLEVNFFDENSYTTKNQLEYDIKQEIKNITFLPPHSNEEKMELDPEDYREHWTIIYSGKKLNEQKYLDILELAIVNGFNLVKEEIKENFYNFINSYETLQQYQIDDLNLELKNIQKDFLIDLETRKKYLEEQIAIAKILNIDQNLNLKNYSLLENSQDFLMGYKILEQELNFLSKDKDGYLSFPESKEINNQIRKIIQNKSIERIKVAFRQTPLFTNDAFKPALIDTALIDIKIINSRKFPIIALSFILGLVFSIIYIAISHNYLERKKGRN